MYANTRWEMHLKAYGDRLSRIRRLLAALGNSATTSRVYRINLNLAKSGMIVKSKNRIRTAGGFYIFLLVSCICLKHILEKNTSRKLKKCPFYVETY
jgi:hypothetical protein